MFSLPAFIKPVPVRFAPEDVAYLSKKGALTVPPLRLRNELLRCYIEYTHPFMPLLDVHEVVNTVDRNDGSSVISLLLYQAVMFCGVATVDVRHLKAAGYSSRREARREYFQKTRLLYDFDYEVDRIALIQALLLMTYWYETPDDQKDSHHWMGIAVSLSHTIGLHRSPERSNMDAGRRKLWKRIWWSTYMRDRLIALGMRRPTRIKNEDFDVPMLTTDDFTIAALPDGPSCIPADRSVMRDVEKQRQLAVMCVEKAKLCVCISHVLVAQYSVLHNNHGVTTEEGTTRTTMMLVRKQLDPEQDSIQNCDKELREWHANLAEEATYQVPVWQDVEYSNGCVVLCRGLLHMVYYATVSALHRPLVLPSAGIPSRNTASEVLDLSRKAVRHAATEITTIAQSLHSLDLVRFLPTTGITVLLPAIIIHLLDIKAPDEPTRRTSLQGFCQCMQIMAKLRDIYAAADYSTAFLEAAIRKAEITLPQKADEVKDPKNIITSTAGLVDAGRRMRLVSSATDSGALTPPPDVPSTTTNPENLTDDEVARQLGSYLAATPPDSENQPGSNNNDRTGGGATSAAPDYEPDFDAFCNLDAAGEVFSLDDGAFAAMQGESSGFTMDMDWMKGMNDDSFATTFN